MRIAFVLAAALLTVSVPAAAQEDPGVEIAGKVVDFSGKPIAGADVAHYFIFEGDQVHPVEGKKSAADGSFRITVQPYGRPFALLAYDAERKRAGMVRLDPQGTKGTVLLYVGPVLRVRGRFACKALGGKPEWTMVYVNTDDGKTRVAQCDSEDAEFSLLLPDGSWNLYMYGTDVGSIDRNVEPKKGKLDQDLGVVEMEATFLALHYGKPLPAWTVSDARGTKATTQLSDYRGKWVLVEFWGFW